MQHQELSMAIRAALSNLENTWEMFTLQQYQRVAERPGMLPREFFISEWLSHL